MSKEISTQDEYIEYCGTRCPACQSNNIEIGASYTFNNGVLRRNVFCNEENCLATWVNNYTVSLYKYSDLSIH